MVRTRLGTVFLDRPNSTSTTFTGVRAFLVGVCFPGGLALPRAPVSTKPPSWCLQSTRASPASLPCLLDYCASTTRIESRWIKCVKGKEEEDHGGAGARFLNRSGGGGGGGGGRGRVDGGARNRSNAAVVTPNGGSYIGFSTLLVSAPTVKGRFKHAAVLL